ncbi:unnamed protein product [Cylicostephanus goldi]|uniref:NNMT/PNMT/TEMT family protein n=1 Tax=Cylicostephanus goldi TaxID=71465 RepID=A0A3P6S750_CYLGO|nr:unnamed protein product [Cylicostephanus goldi]
MIVLEAEDIGITSAKKFSSINDIQFDPRAYLESFYKEPSEDTAMQIVLFFLPGILYRLPRNIRTVLDLGAGPTVYLPIALRNQAQELYTSDYAPANREFLKKWIDDE